MITLVVRLSILGSLSACLYAQDVPPDTRGSEIGLIIGECPEISRRPTRQSLTCAREEIRASYDARFLDDAIALQQIIQALEANGDVELAWELEQDMVRLLERHPGDLRTVAVLSDLAKKRLELFEVYSFGERPEQAKLGCYYVSSRAFNNREGLCRQHSGYSRQVRARIHNEAMDFLNAAIGVLVRNEQFADATLHELEVEVVRQSYRYGYYVDGRNSLARLLSYHNANAETLLTRSLAFVEMADWEVAFLNRVRQARNYENALEMYREVFAALRQGNVANDTIESLFSPLIPVVIPIFQPNPFAAPETRSGDYIDVVFVIGNAGKARKVEFLDRTANVTRADQRELERLLKRSIFRPRSLDGSFTDSPPVVLRYYLSD